METAYDKWLLSMDAGIENPKKTKGGDPLENQKVFFKLV